MRSRVALLVSVALFSQALNHQPRQERCAVQKSNETGRTRTARPRKTYVLMILALITPPVLAGYAIIIGDWVYAIAFGLVSIINFDLYYHSTKKVMPYSFRPFLLLESIIRKEPYDPRLEEKD